MSEDDQTRRRRPKPSTFAGPNLQGKWFRKGGAGILDSEDTDVVNRRSRLNTDENLAVAPWYRRAWLWIRKMVSRSA